MDDDWKTLVKRYADGRQICNCGCAYNSPVGIGISGGVRRTDLMTCEYGCSAAQIFAREYVAKKVLNELP